MNVKTLLQILRLQIDNAELQIELDRYRNVCPDVTIARYDALRSVVSIVKELDE